MLVLSAACIMIHEDVYAQDAGQNLNALNASNVLIVGASEPDAGLEQIENVIDRLQRSLQPHGIDRVILHVAESNRHLIDMVSEDRVDIVLSHGLTAAIELSKNSATSMLQSAVPDFYERHIVIAVRDDSSIQDLNDLNGHRLTFEDTRQNGNFLAPGWALLSEGFKFEYVENIRAPPEPGVISIAFAGRESNMTAWLYRGLVDAFAISMGDWHNKRDVSPEARKEFRLIYDEVIPLHGFAVLISRKSASIEEEILNALSQSDNPDEDGMLFVPVSESNDAKLRSLAAIVRKARKNPLAR